jgi:retinol dehydrogenase-13
MRDDKARVMPSNQQPTDFWSFYNSHFLPEHTHPANVALHVCGTVLGLAYVCGVLWVAASRGGPAWLAALLLFPVVHAVPGLIGHRLFQRSADARVGDLRVLRTDFPLRYFLFGNHVLAASLLAGCCGARRSRPGCAALAALLLAAAMLPAKRYFAGCENPHRPDLSGRTVVITGANAGLGFEMARELLFLNATVVIGGRDAARMAGAAARLRAAARGGGGILDDVGGAPLDLASMASVRSWAAAVAARHARIDVLALNAGVMKVPYALTADGFETTLAANHLGHHLLAALLLPALRAASGGARVIAVSSVGHRWGELDAAALDDLSFERRNDTQVGFAPYTQSKLANVLFAAELARREAAAGSGVRAFSLHPGTVRTDIFRHLAPARALWALETLAAPLLWLVTKSPLEGAQTQLFLATAPGELLADGAYYEDCAISSRVNPLAADADLAQALWRKSDALVGLRGGGPEA